MLTSQEFEPAFLSSVLHLPQLPFNPLPLKKFQIVWKPLCQSLLLPAYFLVFKFSMQQNVLQKIFIEFFS